MLWVQLKQQSTPDDVECSAILGQLKDKLHNALKTLESFQAKNAEHVFNTGTSLPLSSASCFQ